MRTLQVSVHTIVLVISLGFLFGCAPQVRRFDTQELTASDIGAAIKNATTKTDQERIAAYYERAAESNAYRAKRHKNMGDTHAHLGFLKAESLVPTSKHCYGLARTYRGAAERSRCLARQHRQLAEKTH